MLRSKEDLKNNGFIFDYGWKKLIEINFFNEMIKIEIIFDSYKIEDDISENQFESYDNIVEKINEVITKDKSKILNYLEFLGGKNVEVETNRYIVPKQIILGQFDDKDEFGIYCDSILDEENGIGIKVKNYEIKLIGEGDIVI